MAVRNPINVKFALRNFCFPNCAVCSSPLFKEDNTPVFIVMIGSDAFNNSSDFRRD